VKLTDVKTIAVAGVGTMGRGIVQCVAAAGYEVRCYDVAETQLKQSIPLIETMQQILVKEGMLTSEAAKQSLRRIRPSNDLAECLDDAQLVIEAIPEILDTKLFFYSQIDKISKPDVIFASNTSGLSITRLAAATHRQDKVAGFHFWNPAHLMPLIEVTKGEKTSSDTTDLLLALARRLGKKPILVRREVPGFIGNRLQYAVLREALHLVQEKVATPEDVDTAMKAGPGIRYAFLGPLETADLGGLDVFTNICDYLFADLSSDTKPPSYMTNLVKEGKLGVKSGQGFYEYSGKTLVELLSERDQKLIKVLSAMSSKRD
jgi:3-hydroxybutyryl-CoA dehydrogenase